jgi:hypothetical protein
MMYLSSMVMFHSYLTNYQRVIPHHQPILILLISSVPSNIMKPVNHHVYASIFMGLNIHREIPHHRHIFILLIGFDW